MLGMSPWNEAGAGGPFVHAFAIVGVPYAAGIMNAVVITARFLEQQLRPLSYHANAFLAFT